MVRRLLALFPVAVMVGVDLWLDLDQQLVPGVRPYIQHYRVVYFLLLAAGTLCLVGRQGSVLVRCARWSLLGYGSGIVAYLAMACAYPHGCRGLRSALLSSHGLVGPLVIPLVSLSWLLALMAGLGADRLGRTETERTNGPA